jgi:NADPH:quinone reductase-like Zn-dependent oxidoreductase
VGTGVSELSVGDQVYGVTNPQFIGAYAEYAVASAGMVSSKPTSLTHVEAASVPVIAVTAWQALFDHGQLEAGQTVVIHGAAGNVGSYAVQLACRAGVQTTATVATDDISFVRNLGANKVIDYRTQRFEEQVRNADAVIDLVGGETQVRSFQVLRRGGKLISAVSRPDQDLAKRHGVEATFRTRAQRGNAGRAGKDGGATDPGSGNAGGQAPAAAFGHQHRRDRRAARLRGSRLFQPGVQEAHQPLADRIPQERGDL